MISGNATLESINAALQQLSAEEQALNRTLDAATQQVAQARSAEVEAYRDLARFRMGAQGQNIGGALDQASLRARAVLAMRGAEKETIDKRVAAAEKAVADAEAARRAAVAALAAAQDERTKKMLAAEGDLASEAAYEALKTRVESERRIADEADKKATLAEQEQAAKRKPYEDDPVFMYLYERGYGTSAYRSSGLTKMLDGWAARLVGYFDARPNYAMLNEIPVRLRDHATRSRAAATQSGEELAAIQKRAYLKAGGDSLEKTMADANHVIDGHNKTLAEREAALEQAKNERAAFADGRDRNFIEAVEVMASSLKNTALERLYQDAMATPSRDDEAIVERIRTAQHTQRQAESSMVSTRQQMTVVAQRRGQLAQMVQQFRQQRYDAPGWGFDNHVLGNLLQGFIIGAISSSDFWSQLGGSRHRSDGPFGNGGFGDNGWSGQSGNWGGSIGGGFGGSDGGGFGGGGGGGGSDGFSGSDSF